MMDAITQEQQFAEAYKSLITRGDFLEMLRLRARGGLSRFSMGNILWLMFQAEEREEPMPSMLMTYKAWQRLDRQVLKGSAHWSVLRPYHRLTENEDGTKTPLLSGFGSICEFDVSQTDGAELPAPVDDLAGDDFKEHLAQLVAWAEEQQVPVRFIDTGSANGWFDRKENAICIKDTNAPDEQLATLVHELIHWHGHRLRQVRTRRGRNDHRDRRLHRSDGHRTRRHRPEHRVRRPWAETRARTRPHHA